MSWVYEKAFSIESSIDLYPKLNKAELFIQESSYIYILIIIPISSCNELTPQHMFNHYVTGFIFLAKVLCWWQKQALRSSITGLLWVNLCTFVEFPVPEWGIIFVSAFQLELSYELTLLSLGKRQDCNSGIKIFYLQCSKKMNRATTTIVNIALTQSI